MMYSNNIVNFQEFTTTLKACTKKRLESYWIHHVHDPTLTEVREVQFNDNSQYINAPKIILNIILKRSTWRLEKSLTGTPLRDLGVMIKLLHTPYCQLVGWLIDFNRISTH